MVGEFLLHNLIYEKDLITLHGFPAAITLGGISFVTTLLAPMTEFLPMETPFNIVEEYPIKTLSSIFIGLLSGVPCCRCAGSMACQSKSVIRTFAPAITSLPIVMDSFEPMTIALNPQLFPIMICALSLCVAMIDLRFKPMRFEMGDVLILIFSPNEIVDPEKRYTLGIP